MKSKLSLTLLALFSASSLLLQSAQEVAIFPSNSVWRLFVGFSEASPDTNSWRSNTFNDVAFISAPAPFTTDINLNYGTQLPNPADYTCIFLRRTFEITNVSQIAKLRFTANFDDGFVLWINGTEVQRVLVAGTLGTPVAYTDRALFDINTIIPFDLFDVANYLVAGSNVIAVQVFNVSTNSDLFFDASLDAVYVDTPFIVGITPPPGPVDDLTQITVQFSTPVTNVDARDLLINGVPATSLSGSGNIYTFTFPRPKPNGGVVHISWSITNGIADAATNLFDSTIRSAQWDYILPDIAAPTVAELFPGAGSTVRPLSEVRVTFDEAVTNVDAGDLLVNGKPSLSVTQLTSSVYLFRFPTARPGIVNLAWADGDEITDLAPTPHPFGGGAWSYFVDTTPYSVLVNPTNNNAVVVFSNKFFNGVGTVESREGKLWVPIKNFFVTQRVAQIIVTLPTNNYGQLRLRFLDVAPGNAFTHLAKSYGNIHTVAGLGEVPPGTNGWRTNYEGAPATTVNLSNPRTAVADAKGNIYVVEKDGHAVDVIDSQGLIHTVLGTHQAGTSGVNDLIERQPTNSPLNKPTGLWLNNNLLYVLDSGNGRVRVLDTVASTVQTKFLDPAGPITNGGALWVSPSGTSAFYTDGNTLKEWSAKDGMINNGVAILANGFSDLSSVTVNPSDQTIVTDRGDGRVYRIRNSNGEKILVAGTGLAHGPAGAGRPSRVRLPGASSVWYLPIGGYFVGLDDGARVWYVDNGSGNQQGAAPFVFGEPGAHQGDEEWFRAHGRRPKISNVTSITLAPSGDIILVEGDGFIRKIDFLRHTP